MRRTPLGIRGLLVVGSSVVAALMLFVALLVAHVEIASALLTRDQQLAAAEIAPFATDLKNNPKESPDPPSAGVEIAIRNPAGRFVVDTLPAGLRSQLTSSATSEVHTRSIDAVVVRRSVQSASGTWSIWAARDASGRRSTIDIVDASFVVTGLALLAALVLASFALTGAALRPVERMRRAAESLDETELLPVGDADDALARLARTMNDLVTRTRDAALRERRIVSDAAHELRTPIANLQAGLDIALRRSTSAGVPSTELAALGRMAGRLSALAANLLELSRLDEGRPPASATARELLPVIPACVDGARMRFGSMDVDVDYAVGPLDPELRVAVDPVSFGRVVDNLVNNAVEAMEGVGTVLVTLEAAESGIRLSVDDDGPGMPDDLLTTVFERFTRGAAAGSGSGLGLALVKAIATAAGGTASIDRLAAGLRITVMFPKM